MKTIYIIRGLPGSGKSTLAKNITPFNFEADTYFINERMEYVYDGSRIAEAHKWCQEQVARAMQSRCHPLAVANTFSRRWEMLPYTQLALEYGYVVVELTMNSQFKSVHNVPIESMQKMAERWEK